MKARNRSSAWRTISASFSFTATMVRPLSGSMATRSATAGRSGKPSMQEPNFCASSNAVSSADAIAALCSVGTRMVFMHTPRMPPAKPAGRLPLAGTSAEQSYCRVAGCRTSTCWPAPTPIVPRSDGTGQETPGRSTMRRGLIAAFGLALLWTAAAGAGTITHLAVELLKEEAKIDLVHVPYRGIAPGVSGLLGGQVQLLVADVPFLLPQIKSGAIKALALTSAARTPALPDVPTTAELGYPRVNSDNWYGLGAPPRPP